MITFPNAKINLGLNITARRSDGYHNLETLFYPIGLKDILEIVPTQDLSLPSGNCTFHSTGLDLECPPANNLIVKAYHLLNSFYPLPAVDIHLWKIVPFKAGLGGGSADAAFALKLLNELADLKLPDNELEKLAVQLGADCPFFIRNQPVIATGIGNIFEEITISLKGYLIYLFKPKEEVSTKEAYAGVTPKKPITPIHEIVSNYAVEEWKNRLVNDFEESILKTHPNLHRIKEMLYENGALYASMTGSGSAFYGLFREKVNLEHLFGNAFVWSGVLQ